jgi:hypothetical protein|tara:strand:+ start:939 stop:1094 length:156 start_codon:yes stop_codon:yes gene_type:complete
MKKGKPRGDATPIKKYENGEFMPYPFGPVQKLKSKNSNMKINRFKRKSKTS